MVKTDVIKLHCSDGTYLFPTVISCGNDLILIDCGYDGQLEQLRDEFLRLGRRLSELTAIIITHHDIDHMGGLYELKKAVPSIAIMSSALEVPFIEGRNKSLRLLQAVAHRKTLSGSASQEAKKFEHFLKSVKYCEVNVILEEGISPFGCIEIISTPGHMPGHISIYVPQQKTLIAADALVWENYRFDIANPTFTLDKGTAVQSLKKILEIAPEKIICYHGGAVDEHIDPLLVELIKRYQ